MRTKSAAILMFLVLLSASIPLAMHTKPVRADPPIIMAVEPECSRRAR